MSVRWDVGHLYYASVQDGWYTYLRHGKKSAHTFTVAVHGDNAYFDLVFLPPSILCRTAITYQCLLNGHRSIGHCIYGQNYLSRFKRQGCVCNV